jgi:hypothetical protein
LQIGGGGGGGRGGGVTTAPSGTAGPETELKYFLKSEDFQKNTQPSYIKGAILALPTYL